MTTPIDTYAATLTSLEDKTLTNADVTSLVTSSAKPEGNHGLGYLVAHFSVAKLLIEKDVAALPTGTYDLGEEFPAGAIVAGDALLVVTEDEAGSGDQHVLLEGGTAIAASTDAANGAIAGDFAIGAAVGGKKLQALVDTDTLTAGAFTVTVPYRING
jgi:hypothetical protein